MHSHFLRRVFSRSVFSVLLALCATALTRAADGIEWVTISMPPTGGAGTMLQFNATVKNTGDTTWGGDYYLELKDAAGNHLYYPSVAGVAPGATVSRIFLLYLPANLGNQTYSFTGLHHNVAYFGPTVTRTITIMSGPVSDGVRLAGTQLQDGSYPLVTGSLPIINSPDSLTPNYRLRAKVIDDTQYGWHAATTWNNKGLPLDSAPPIPGTYPVCALYWLKYDSYQGTLLEIGQERVVSVTVPGGIVALSSHCFGTLQPPQIYTTEPLTGNFRLEATFRYPNGSSVSFTETPMGSTSATLASLPPPGDYQVELTWKRYGFNGAPFSTGPTFTQRVVIYPGVGPVLSADGSVDATTGQDENGDWGTTFSEPSHAFNVPLDGTLEISGTALFDLRIELVRLDSTENGTTIVSNGGTNFSTWVTAGDYRLKIFSVNGGYGSYHLSGIVSTTVAPPVYSSDQGTATGTFGTSFTYSAVASGAGPFTYATPNPAQPLPPGLSLGSGGIVAGFPTTAGTYQSRIRATNSVGVMAEKTVTFTIARAKPEALFPSVIVSDQPALMVTQAMLDAAVFLRPAGAPTTVPAPTGTITFSAVRKLAPLTAYDPFTPASIASGLTASFGELLVTANCPGNPNYESATVTTTFWNLYLAAPVSFAAEQVTSSRFLASWSAVPGATGYRLDVSANATFTNLILNNYSPVYVFNGQSSIATSQTVTGLAPNTDYWYRVRAVTSAGTSANSSVISVRTAAPVTGAASLWFDKPRDVRNPVTGAWTKVTDGLLDEIIPASGSHGLTYYVLDYRYTGGTVTFDDYEFPTNDWWYPRNVGFDFNGDGTSDFERPSFTPFWQSGITFSYTGEIYQRIGVEFDPELGYDYEICYSQNDIINPSSLEVVNGGGHIYPQNADRMIFALFNEFTIAALNRGSLYLVRYAKPVASTLLTIPGVGPATVGIRTTGGGPSTGPISIGGVTIDLGLGGGSIVFPGGGTITVGSGGAVSVTGFPGVPGGPVTGNVSLGGLGSIQVGPGGTATVTVGSGVPVLGGAVITGSAGGGGSIAFPNGVGIRVSSTGKLGITLPPGTDQTLVRIIDIAAKVLSVANGASISVRDILGNVIPLPTSGVLGSIDAAITSKGRFEVGVKVGNDSWFWFDVFTAPALPLRSRDRFLAGAIDTSESFYRDNSLEFVRLATPTSPEENLGTYRVDGSSGTFIYNSEDAILSEAEFDGVVAGSLNSGSQQLIQPVVFWREAPDSSVIRFSTIFSAVGAIEIRVKNPSGTVLKNIQHTLTSEPNFAGLLVHMDTRIRSLTMPAVSPWSLLPPANGIDDDGPAAAAITPRRAAAAISLFNSVPPPVARTGWQTNFLVKGATMADKAITSEPAGVYALKIAGGFFIGFCDGLWDGLKSDVEGVVQLAMIGVDGIRGDFTRVMQMWNGIRDLLKLSSAQRSALLDSMVQKIVATSTASVPWIPTGTDADDWGVAAYISGYTVGFVAEQVVVIMAGAGIITKAGQATKVALTASEIGKITVQMVSNTRRFVTASTLAVARHVSAHGSGAVRAVRKAVEDVAKRAVFQGKLVGEEIGALMERFGVSQLTYQYIADRLSIVCQTEAQWLKILPTANERLADLSARLGIQLTDSGAKGFLEYWAHALQVQAVPPGDLMGHFLHVCSTNGVLDTQGVARILEMFDRAGASTFKFTQDVQDLSK